MKRYGWRDDQFARIANMPQLRPGSGTRPNLRGNRLSVEAVIRNLRADSSCRDLAARVSNMIEHFRIFASGDAETAGHALAGHHSICALARRT